MCYGGCKHTTLSVVCEPAQTDASGITNLPIFRLPSSIILLGFPLSGSIADGRGGGVPNAEGLTDNKPIILYESSQQGSEISSTTWMLLMLSVVAVVLIMQAANGMFHRLLRKQQKKMRRHRKPNCNDTDTDTDTDMSLF